MITMRSKFKRAKPVQEAPPDTLSVERHWYEYARNKIESQKVLLRGFIGLTLCCAGFTCLTWQQQVQIEALRHKPVALGPAPGSVYPGTKLIAMKPDYFELDGCHVDMSTCALPDMRIRYQMPDGTWRLERAYKDGVWQFEDGSGEGLVTSDSGVTSWCDPSGHIVIESTPAVAGATTFTLPDKNGGGGGGGMYCYRTK